MITPFHAKYFAHALTRHCPSASVQKLAASLADAQVDLNPHQIDAANAVADLFDSQPLNAPDYATLFRTFDKTPTAKLAIHVHTRSGIQEREVRVKGQEDLFLLSGERECCRNGLVVDYVDATR